MLGVVERGGKVITRVMTNLSGTTIAKFIARFVRGGSMLMTDECRDYALVRRIMRQDVIQHNERKLIGLTYDKLPIHTNNIECFSRLLKRSWYANLHHKSRTVL